MPKAALYLPPFRGIFTLSDRTNRRYFSGAQLLEPTPSLCVEAAEVWIRSSCCRIPTWDHHPSIHASPSHLEWQIEPNCIAF